MGKVDLEIKENGRSKSDVLDWKSENINTINMTFDSSEKLRISQDEHRHGTKSSQTGASI